MTAEPRPALLIVEDNVDVRRSLELALDEENYSVSAVSNGKEALAWLRTNPAPSLILLDLLMPVMSGSEFRQAQLDDPPLADIPVVLLSGVGDVHHQVAELKVDGYLRKPLDIPILMQVVRGYCR